MNLATVSIKCKIKTILTESGQLYKHKYLIINGTYRSKPSYDTRKMEIKRKLGETRIYKKRNIYVFVRNYDFNITFSSILDISTK